MYTCYVLAHAVSFPNWKVSSESLGFRCVLLCLEHSRHTLALRFLLRERIDGGWVDGWGDGWMDGGMEGSMDPWVDRRREG